MKEHATGASSSSIGPAQQDIPPSIGRRRKLVSSMALAVAGAAMLGTQDVSAEPVNRAQANTAGGEQSVADLKAQVERLTRELEASKQREQELINKNIAVEPAAAPVDAGVAAVPAGQDNAVAAAESEVKAEEVKAEEPKNLAEVTVTSRRKEEKLQEVPIPIAVISGEQMKRDNIVSVADFARRAPNLGVTNTNARQTSIALRGLGKNAGNESMESSVGVMIDNVWQSWVGSTWVNFADIDHVEVLRGPQGTLQGKNSNLGLINVVSQAPSFKSGYYADGFAGNRNSLQGKFGATGTILPGLLAYRASGYIDKRDGFVENLDIAVTDGKLQETESLGGRLQFLLTPSDELSARFILDRTASTQSMSVNPNMLDPATFADGTARTTTYSSRLGRDWFDVFTRSGQPITVIGDPRKVAQDDKQKSRADSEGVSAEINWDLLGHRFTSVSAYRNALFEPHHDGDRSVADIMRIGGVTVDNEQWSQEFRIASREPGPIDYQAGFFAMRSVAETLSQNHFGDDAGAFYASNAQYNRLNSSAVGRQMMSASLRELMDTAYLNPATDSYAGYGQLNWHITDAATLTLGLRNTFEQRSNSGNHRALGGADLTALGSSIGASAQNLADAQAIRSGQIRPDWVAERQGFDQNSQNWLVNPSYKITDDIMAYFSVAGGQKSGAAQFNANTGEVENVDPEDVMDYELGIKSSWLDRTLVFNLNLYQTDVEGFQSQLVFPDEDRPGQFRTRLGNIEGIQLRGVELETSWDVTPGLNLFLNGSYNHAVYTDFRNAPCPPEANQPICDQTGQTLPNAPAFTANFGFDYRVPFGFGVGDDYGLQWHAFMVDSFKSAANYNASLSESGKQPAYHVTDGGIGLGTKNGKYNLDLVGRNIFDTIYLTNSSNWSSTGASTGTFGDARYYGVHFRAKF
ncbi:MAG: TonB-dependent receptor domain-containing protein [Methylomicrobium sp.]